MDGRMLTAENEMGCCLNSLTQTEEHGNLSCFAYVFHLSLYLLSPLSCCRFYSLLFIVSYNEEYFVLSAPSKSKSVKPSFLNSNYESKISFVASDCEKCPKAV